MKRVLIFSLVCCAVFLVSAILLRFDQASGIKGGITIIVLLASGASFAVGFVVVAVKNAFRQIN